jgi:hypothetical protein
MNMAFFETLLPRLAERDFDITFFYETKSNLRKEQIAKFREAGVRAIQAGIESLSSHKLQRMKKGERAIQNVQTLKWASELHVLLCWNWLHGLPGETDRDLEQELDVMASITHLIPPAATGEVEFDRFSPYFNDAKDYGIKVLGPSEHYRYAYGVEEDLLRKIGHPSRHHGADAIQPDLLGSRPP